MSAPVAQADADVLAECMALSSADDDVHACLDNYLDVMDGSIGEVVGSIRGTLRGEPLAAFERSQASFEAFRRDNCLWYLAFTTPRSDAEKIAKNCLAGSSLDRLVELQGLMLADTEAVFTFDGYYAFDSDRNSFQPCGSERRFWMAGDDNAIASLQQQYLERTSEEGQLMFVRLDGALQQADDARPEHAGRFKLDAVRALREPQDTDCRLPGGSPPVVAASDIPVGPRPTGDRAVSDNPVADPDSDPDPLAGIDVDAEAVPAAPDRAVRDDRLIAYFGAWLADCETRAGRSACRLVVDFDDGDLPRLTLARGEDALTRVTLALPSGAAATAEQVRWSVDDQTLGVIQSARLRQGDQGVELALLDQRFVDDRLLPLLRDGYTLSVNTLGDDTARQATLVGLTRALAFADDFIGLGDP